MDDSRAPEAADWTPQQKKPRGRPRKRLNDESIINDDMKAMNEDVGTKQPEAVKDQNSLTQGSSASSGKIQKYENSSKCINCNASHPAHSKVLVQIGRQTSITKSILSHWVSPHILAENDLICRFCLLHAQKAQNKIISDNDQLTIDEIEKSELIKVENRQYCIVCGVSIFRSRSKSFNFSSPTELEIKAMAIVSASIGAHRKINPETKTCFNCWQKAVRRVEPVKKKNDDQNKTVDTLPDPESAAVSDLNSIELPTYKKISYSKDHCIFPNCSNQNLQTVSNKFQVGTIKHYNIYIPPRSMICGTHLNGIDWTALKKDKTNVSIFTVDDIEQIFSLIQTKSKTDVNFKNYMTIDEHTFIYFLGINRETLSVILKYLPQIEEIDHGVLGLIGLFIKHENGGPNDRIANLLKLSLDSLEIAMETVKELLVCNPVVTTNMGIEYLLKKEL